MARQASIQEERTPKAYGRSGGRPKRLPVRSLKMKGRGIWLAFVLVACSEVRIEDAAGGGGASSDTVAGTGVSNVSSTVTGAGSGTSIATGTTTSTGTGGEGGSPIPLPPCGGFVDSFDGDTLDETRWLDAVDYLEVSGGDVALDGFGFLMVKDGDNDVVDGCAAVVRVSEPTQPLRVRSFGAANVGDGFVIAQEPGSMSYYFSSVLGEEADVVPATDVEAFGLAFFEGEALAIYRDPSGWNVLARAPVEVATGYFDLGLQVLDTVEAPPVRVADYGLAEVTDVDLALGR
jgi:hypothetical protein